MIGDGIIFDGSQYEAEQAAKALDQWNSLAEDHCRLCWENEELRKLLKEAWHLSTWAGSINWHGGENQKEWLDELRQKIESFQTQYKQLDKPTHD